MSDDDGAHCIGRMGLTISISFSFTHSFHFIWIGLHRALSLSLFILRFRQSLRDDAFLSIALFRRLTVFWSLLFWKIKRKEMRTTLSVARSKAKMIRNHSHLFWLYAKQFGMEKRRLTVVGAARFSLAANGIQLVRLQFWHLYIVCTMLSCISLYYMFLNNALRRVVKRQSACAGIFYLPISHNVCSFMYRISDWTTRLPCMASPALAKVKRTWETKTEITFDLNREFFSCLFIWPWWTM